MRITLLVAMSQEGVIGINNRLPWHLPADLAYFKQKTLHKTIVMGRHTYESIGKPLPHRTNLVLTTNPHYTAQGCEVYHSISACLAAKQGIEELIVIGGAQIYQAFLPLATHLAITQVHHQVQGDTFFPTYDKSEWCLLKETYHPQDELNEFAMTFCLYERQNKVSLKG